MQNLHFLVQLLHSSGEGHRFRGLGPPGARGTPGVPDASQMPPGCLPDVSLLNHCSLMIPSLCLLLQWFLLHDSSSVISLSCFLKLVYKKTLFGVSCWGHSPRMGIIELIKGRRDSWDLPLLRNQCKWNICGEWGHHLINISKYE